jgi:hypothetical protein
MYGKTLPRWDLNHIIDLERAKGIEKFVKIWYNIKYYMTY